MEVEIKLQVLPSVQGGPAGLFERLARAAELAGYPLGPVEPVALRDVYFDTADGALAAARCGLRLRIENGVALVTLKFTRRQTGALSARDEYEYALNAASLADVLSHIREVVGPDPVPLADFAAGRPAGPLVPVLDVVTERTARTIGQVAKLTLDRVAYPGLVDDPLFDIEVEAEEGLGDEGPLRSIEAELLRLAGGHLLPAELSKLERGLRLRNG